MAEEKEEKGFVIRDKRFSARKEEEGKKVEESAKAQVNESKREEMKKEGPLPEITFSSLIFSFSTSALIQLGEIEDPVTKRRDKNLPLAKQTIDLIGMLKEKTKGNLTPEEESLIDQVLFDLRMRYVKAVS
jgi:hypothetical protein